MSDNWMKQYMRRQQIIENKGNKMSLRNICPKHGERDLDGTNIKQGVPKCSQCDSLLLTQDKSVKTQKGNFRCWLGHHGEGTEIRIRCSAINSEFCLERK